MYIIQHPDNCEKTNSSTSGVSAKQKVVCIFLIASVTGIIGSVFFLLILIIRRKSIKMRSTLRISLSYLLVADIFRLTFNLNFHSDDVRNSDEQEINAFLCYGIESLQWILRSLPAYIQAVISIERAVTVALPLRVKILITRGRMIAALITVSFFVIILQTAGSVIMVKYYRCPCQWHRYASIIRGYLFQADYQFITYFLIPSCVLITSTCVIIVMLVRQRRLRMSESQMRLSSSNKRLCVVVVVMDIIYILTIWPYVVVFWKRLPADDFFHFTSLKSMKLASATDWLVLLLFSSQIRKAANPFTWKIRRPNSSTEQTHS